MKQIFIVFIISLSLWLPSVGATTLSAARCAEAVLAPKATSQLPEGHYIIADHHKDDNGYEHFTYKINDEEAGILKYQFDPQRNSLHIDALIVEARYRKQGFSIKLLTSALTKYPHTQMINGMLVGTNIDAYKLALTRGLSPKEAIKETPAYRIRARFGFTKVIEVDPITGFFEDVIGVYLVVALPDIPPVDSSSIANSRGDSSRAAP